MTDRGETPDEPRNGGKPANGALPPERSALSRRTLIISGASIVGAGVAGALALRSLDGLVDVAAASSPSVGPSSTPTPAAGPTHSIAEVRADARASTGMRFAGSPWQGSPADDVATWSATFALWLLRGNVTATAADPQSLHDRFADAGLVGTEPREGALIFYTAGTPTSVYHVGFVDAVGAAGTHTVEGDVPGDLPPDRTFVRIYGQPWDADVLFGYPAYRAA